MIYITSAIALVTGLVLGSFFNVLIWRIPRGESIVKPASHCPRCARPIRPHENIPLLSYVLLKGKCAGCGAPIPLRYPAVELATGLAALLLWSAYVVPYRAASPHPWTLVPLGVRCAALLLLIPIAAIDLKHLIIPDSFTLPGLAVALAMSLVPGDLAPLDSLLGALAGGGSLLVIGKLGEILLRRREAMGGGDIKLMAFLGAACGWQAALGGIVFGSLLGAIAGVSLLLFRVLPQDHRIPFGPFLGVGTWVAVLAGEPIIRWYFAFIESVLL
jgi:leader peptidase (prepilin peptidase)/N-methyltransferase